MRAELRKKKLSKYNERAKAEADKAVKRVTLKLDKGPPKGELDNSVLFA